MTDAWTWSRNANAAAVSPCPRPLSGSAAMAAPGVDGPGGKRKADGPKNKEDMMEITPLGAGQEVGRSCVVLKYKGKTIMFDCGIHPARAGIAGLPFFDEIDPATIDILLISHFHLDHAAALPYFVEKTTFRGKVIMTHPTKAIYKMLLTDFLKVSHSADDMLYNEDNLKKSMDKIQAVNYHQEIEHNGVKFWCYNAGHVLGAAMFMVEIAGVRVLYTGDFSRQEDRHLMAAELPSSNVDVLVVESTYGVQTHEPREERETRFTNIVSDIVRRGGRCLLPVFALGRAQEVLLILDEYWEAHPELQNVPIYYASTLAQKCMKVYQAYINMMNERIRAQYTISNPFKFNHISYLKGIEHFDDIGPSVVMASPGMLQSGLSRDLFERWAPDKKNGVVLTGYSVEGTLAKHIMSEPPDVTTTSGLTIPLNLSVTYISFSAHSDFKHTSEFIDSLMPPYIVLVHGDSNEMGRLRAELSRRYEGKPVQVMMPKNTQTVELKFKADKMAKTVGQLASQPPADGRHLGGVLVKKDFTHHLMAPTDLHTYTQLSTASVVQRLNLAFHRPYAALKAYLEQIHQHVVELGRPPLENGALKVLDLITVHYNSKNLEDPDTLTLEWTSDPFNDMLADSLIALLLQLDVSPVPVRGRPTAPADRTAAILDLLTHIYGEVLQRADQPSILDLAVDGARATVDVSAMSVTSDNPSLRARVQKTLSRMTLSN